MNYLEKYKSPRSSKHRWEPLLLARGWSSVSSGAGDAFIVQARFRGCRQGKTIRFRATVRVSNDRDSQDGNTQIFRGSISVCDQPMQRVIHECEVSNLVGLASALKDLHQMYKERSWTGHACQ